MSASRPAVVASKSVELPLGPPWINKIASFFLSLTWTEADLHWMLLTYSTASLYSRISITIPADLTAECCCRISSYSFKRSSLTAMLNFSAINEFQILCNGLFGPIADRRTFESKTTSTGINHLVYGNDRGSF